MERLEKLVRRAADIVRIAETTPDVPRTLNSEMLQADIRRIQKVTRCPFTEFLRRTAFFWFRIYVRELDFNSGKDERVNIRIPIPIPFVGALFRRQLSRRQALKAITLVRQEANGPKLVEAYLDSCMALEFLRVEESDPERGRWELVVIGLD
ncbi:hypothetical protein J7M22_06860 [Candidatus Poribacteria bacterium]|nr:hypothetical protein [Candidatus Poribacteria bacterium]